MTTTPPPAHPGMPTNAGEVLPDWIDGNAHMNVAHYGLQFDRASRAFFRAIGMDKDYRVRTGLGIFTVEERIVYLGELRLGEGFTVHSRLIGLDDKRVIVLHEMWRRRDDKLAAFQETLYLHIDRRVRRAAPLSEELLVNLRPLLAAHAVDALPARVGQPVALPKKPASA